ncbi:uncharacterized protein [Amphiura filiformis]|uniref:uncharacterized protein n=1 Tax=Amphiura filiformis TaxID=82378 RepID=UPI003B22021F
MDNRSTFRAYNRPTPAAADIYIGSNTGPGCKKRRPWGLLTLIGFVCVIVAIFQIGVVDKYITGHPVSLHNVHAKESWSHLIIHGAGDKQIENAKSVNSSESSNSTKCKVPRFDPKTDHPPYVSCKRVQPLPDSCDLAHKIYLSQPKPVCPDQRELSICQFQNNNTYHGIKCSDSMCESPISLGAINPQDGTLKWSIFTDINDLENSILDFLNKNSSNGNYGFCYLKCTLKDKKLGNQLLLIPQHFTQNTCKDKTCCDAITINVIWLDSTSHSHFFRSLPKSVTALRNAKENKLAHVFNYNLMQTMAGRTFANTMMFTLGNHRARTGIGKLFKLFQNGGYHVTWIDDLCWSERIQAKRVVGMPRFLGIKKEESTVSKSWKTLHKVLKSKGVDQIGLSAANCEIWKSNGLEHPFGEDPKPICYNGKYQVDYMLSYMESLQNQLSNGTCKGPFLNYLELNVCHEPSGRRCQTLDESLAKFINFLNKQSNTFTFIFGDHGLAYGPFLKTTAEAKVELAHPVSFIHVSNDLEEKLGKYKMESLRLNQDRLIDIVDLRQTLLTFSPDNDKSIFRLDKKYDTHPNGLFHPIDPKRSCRTLGIDLESKKCICEEGRRSHKMSNETRVKVLADFALGQINNIIQDQFVAANEESPSGFGSCERLVGTWVGNVVESYHQDTTVIEMDLHLPAKPHAPEADDVFSAVVEVTSNSQDGPSLHLVHYERTSVYVVYEQCRDKGVEAKLCICSPSNRSTPIRQWHIEPPVVFGTVTKVISLNEHVFIYERRSLYGIILEVSCEQPNGVFEIALVIVNSLNVVSSTTLHQQTITIKYQRIYFLSAFYQLDPSNKWTLEYDVQFRQIF